MDNRTIENRVGNEAIKEEIALSEKQRKLSRLHFNIVLLKQGRFDILKSDEFVAELARYLADPKSEKENLRNELLTRLGESSLVEDSTLKGRSLMVLSLSAEKFLLENHKKSIFLITKLFAEWLYFEEILISGYDVIIRRIGELSAWLMDNNYWENAEKILSVISQIQTGKIKKNTAIRVLITSVQEKLATRRIMEKLTDHYLLNDSDQKIYKKLLISLGKKSAIFLLDKTISSQTKDEKSTLSGLVLCFGSIAVPVFKEYLEKFSSWEVLHPVLYMIAELEEGSFYSSILRFIGHEDIRVQREAVRCIVKIGGSELQQRLTTVLTLVDDSLKEMIIRQLMRSGEQSESVIEVLCKLARDRVELDSPADEELIKTIIVALKKYPVSKSAAFLEEMLAKYQNKVGREELTIQIKESLRIIRPQIRHYLRRADGREEAIAFDGDPVQRQQVFMKVRKIEAEIKEALESGDLGTAGKVLYDHAIDAARRKNFREAELLRDRMLGINPMAVTEVITLGEAIEVEKKRSIPSHYLQTWDHLKKEMSLEDLGILYKGLYDARYEKDAIIAQSGEIDNSLYFINAGYVGLSCNSGAKETFLRRMQPGDILGAEQFFSVSVWTVTLTALSEVQIQVLDYAALRKISTVSPGIEGALRKYCADCTQISQFLKVSGEDRREYPRYPTTLAVRNMLLDPYGKKGKRYIMGELVDISRGGLAFNIRISSGENARLLLGRQMIAAIPMGKGEITQCVGVIVGVRKYDFSESDFSVHVKFFKTLGQEFLEIKAGLGKIIGVK